MKKRTNAKRIVFFSIILVLVLIMICSGLQILESTVFHSSDEPEATKSSKTVIKDGVKYFPRQDIDVVMLLGIDQFGPVADSGSYNNNGSADVVVLLVIDETNERVSILNINRDTITDIPVLGIGGKPAGSMPAQLALAHTYGSGLSDSCENTKKAVSNLLNGIYIDYYLSMNMDAITIVNDAVGGVTVQVEDDFSQVDPSITLGEVTLMGEQAINYVRSRMGVGDQLNTSRNRRQAEYMEGFFAALRTATDADSNFVLKTYEALSPYIVSDCSVNTLSSIFSRCKDFEILEARSLEGKSVLGNEYYEFYPDEEALQDLVLELFYAPK